MDILDQNLAGAGAGVGFADVVDGDDPEAIALQLTEAGNGELSRGVRGVGVVHPYPL